MIHFCQDQMNRYTSSILIIFYSRVIIIRGWRRSPLGWRRSPQVASRAAVRQPRVRSSARAPQNMKYTKRVATILKKKKEKMIYINRYLLVPQHRLHYMIPIFDIDIFAPSELHSPQDSSFQKDFFYHSIFAKPVKGLWHYIFVHIFVHI